MRERSIVIDPQNAITKDNVSVEVSGNLYVQFEDPTRAAYGSKNPLYSGETVISIHTHLSKTPLWSCWTSC